MRKLSIVALLLFAGMAAASAQAYPSKPITMIVPFAAGGATDVLARFLGLPHARIQQEVFRHANAPARPRVGAPSAAPRSACAGPAARRSRRQRR